jgi:hypothetical protein
MPSRFLNNIRINDEYTLPSSDGSANQVITTDGAGQLSFVDQSTINAGKAEHIVIYAKNTSGSQIDKGTPVYITGTVGATDTVQIAPADAGNASHMPAVGLLDDTLINNAFGYVITGGFMDNITTDPIDGATPSSNDTVYVKVGGGLTLTKPTGPTGLIQNVAKVGKVSGGNSGSLIVSSILRTNDVPNLPTGKIWVGDGNTIVSDTVYLDETNGRMGIGTTSPSAKLEVNGDIAVSGDNKVYSEGDTLTLRAGGASGTYLMVDDTVGGVGIGTTSIGYALDVNGDVRASSNLYLGSYVYHNGDTNTYFGFPTNDTYAVRTNGSDILYINSSGDVGIGTTSPDRRLHVQDSAIVITKLEGTNQGSLLDLVNSNAIQTYNGLRFTQGTTGKMAITHIADGTTKGYVQIGNNWAAGSEILVVDGRTSNVGIGTTSPGARLEVKSAGPDTFFADFISSTGSGSAKIYENSNSHPLLYMADATGTTTVVLNSSGVSYLISGNIIIGGTADNGNLLQVQGTSYFDGNVGIGTTSPSYKLDVSGTGRFTDTLTVQGTGNSSFAGNIILNTNATYLYGELLAGTQTRIHGINSSNLEWVGSIDALVAGTLIGNNTSYINLRTGNTDRVRVDSSGNVGIGTTSPSYKLDVSGTGRFTGTTLFQSQLTVAESSGDSVLEVGNSGIGGNHRINIIAAGSGQDAGYYISGTPRVYTNTGNTSITRINAPSTGIIQFETNLTERVRINNGGNVSIGNTNNTYRLDVSGTGRFTSDLTVQGTGDSSFAGNVGIGTTSPSEKLEVNGTIKATDYKGYLTTFQHGGFQHTASTSSTTVYWIPTNSVSEVISSQSYNNWVAPYDGRVKKIVMRWASNGTPTATSVTFRKAINGTTDATLYSATVTSPATTDMIVERDFLSTDISFQAGDRVQLGFTTDGGTGLLQGFAYTIVLEYNKI